MPSQGKIQRAVKWVLDEILSHFRWIDRNTWKPLILIILNSFWYGALTMPISKVLTDLVGTFRMTLVILVSSAVALRGYKLGAWLNFRLGSDRVCRWILFVYTGTLLFFFAKEWITAAWVVLGVINAVAYTSIDAVFRQKIEEVIPDETNRRRIIGAKECLCLLAGGAGAYVASKLITNTYTNWIALVISFVLLGIILAWQVHLDHHATSIQQQEHSERKGIREKITKRLTAIKANRQFNRRLNNIALPYVGVSLANSIFSLLLPLTAGVDITGTFFLINRIFNAIGNLSASYLIKERRKIEVWGPILVIVIGLAIIPLGEQFTPCYYLAAALTGFASPIEKLAITHRLRQAVTKEEQGKATAPLFIKSEQGYMAGTVLIMVLSLFANVSAEPWIWFVVAVIPLLITAYAMRKVHP